MKNEFNSNERYNQLYMKYRQLFEDMLMKKEHKNLSNRTVIELAIILKEEYPNKSNAITRVNSLFMQEQTLDNLKELLDLYEFIKE